MLSEALQSKWPARVAVMHTAAPDRAAELAQAVSESLHPAELLTTEFSSVMAVHTGPGFVGLAVCPDE
jgi:fatty acid-binding protein DegV